MGKLLTYLDFGRCLGVFKSLSVCVYSYVFNVLYARCNNTVERVTSASADAYYFNLGKIYSFIFHNEAHFLIPPLSINQCLFFSTGWDTIYAEEKPHTSKYSIIVA